MFTPGTKVTVPAYRVHSSALLEGTITAAAPYTRDAYRVYVPAFGQTMTYLAREVTALA